MDLSPVVSGILVGVASGAASAFVALAVLGNRVATLEKTTDRLAEAVEGSEGLQVRVGILENR